MNRLTTASEGTGWTQKYVYDPVGNRAVYSGGSSVVTSGLTPQTSVDTVNAGGWTCGNLQQMPFNCKNQWNIASGYDAAGNLIYLPNGTVSQQSLTYDADNRLVGQTVTGNSPSPLVAVSFAYDGDGRRVMKTVGGVQTVYVYDPLGQLAAEYGGALGVPGTYYVTQDHLGSTRLVTKGGAAVACHDYLPFGEEIPASWGARSMPCYGPTVTQEKFTGQLRDSESGLDFFQARYMAGYLGRFLSPDPGNAGASLGNPQSWNGYSYGLNNPMRLVDPSGRCSRDSDGNFHDDGDSEFPGPCVQGNAATASIQELEYDPGMSRVQASPSITSRAAADLERFKDRLNCAARFGDDHSIAAAFQAQDTFVGQFLAGNTVSGLADVYLNVTGYSTPTVGDLGQIALGGAGQGLPPVHGESTFRTLFNGAKDLGGHSAGWDGATGMAVDGLVSKAVEGAGALATTGLLVRTAPSLLKAVNVLNIVVWGQLGLDVGTFGYGYFFACK